MTAAKTLRLSAFRHSGGSWSGAVQPARTLISLQMAEQRGNVRVYVRRPGSGVT